MSGPGSGSKWKTWRGGGGGTRFEKLLCLRACTFPRVTRNPLNRGFLWNGVWNWSTECFEIIGLFLLGVQVCGRGEKGGIFVDFLKVCVVINKRMDLFLQKINIVFYCSFETPKDLYTRRKKNEYNKFSLIFIKK